MDQLTRSLTNLAEKILTVHEDLRVMSMHLRLANRDPMHSRPSQLSRSALRRSKLARGSRAFVQDASRDSGPENSLCTRVLLSLLCLTAACGFPRPADVPEPISCTANEFIGCDGNSTRTCNAAGDGAVTLD